MNPIIFDDDLNHPVKDGLCPYRDEFDLSLKAKRELSDLYLKLIDERKAITKEEKKSEIDTVLGQ